MIDYELARELREKGFPVKPFGYAPDVFDEGFIAPTLSELIEACGEEFNALFSGWKDIHKGYRDEDRQWRADATNKTGYSCTGTTPSEAVARLWLALQKK